MLKALNLKENAIFISNLNTICNYKHIYYATIFC